MTRNIVTTSPEPTGQPTAGQPAPAEAGAAETGANDSTAVNSAAADSAAAPVKMAPAEPGEPLPPGYEDYAGEITVANGPMPLWFRRLPYVAILAALAYYLHARAFDRINLVFAGLFIVWMIYTPIAQKRGWFYIPM